MNNTDFEKLVRNMRDYQQRYFKSRDSYDLRCAKDLERRVDAELAQRLRNKSDQGSLFSKGA